MELMRLSGISTKTNFSWFSYLVAELLLPEQRRLPIKTLYRFIMSNKQATKNRHTENDFLFFSYFSLAVAAELDVENSIFLSSLMNFVDVVYSSSSFMNFSHMFKPSHTIHMLKFSGIAYSRLHWCECTQQHVH